MRKGKACAHDAPVFRSHHSSRALSNVFPGQMHLNHVASHSQTPFDCSCMQHTAMGIHSAGRWRGYDNILPLLHPLYPVDISSPPGCNDTSETSSPYVILLYPPLIHCLFLTQLVYNTVHFTTAPPLCCLLLISFV